MAYPLDKKQAALDLYNDGWRCRAISKHLGVPLATIYSWTRELTREKARLAHAAITATDRILASPNPCRNREALTQALELIRETLSVLTRKPDNPNG